jgi:hypothetical protein
MNPKYLFAPVVAALCIPGLASAQQFVLGDGNATARFNTNTAAGQDQWTIANVNQMTQQAFWVRAGTDTRENPLSSLVQVMAQATDTNTFSDNRNDNLAVLYRDANNRYTVETNFTLRGGTGTQIFSDLAETLRITNTQTSGTLAFSFFQYVNLDLNGTVSDANAVIQNARVALQEDGTLGSAETVVTSAPTRFQVGLAPTILNALNDAAVSNLTNAAGPIGPGDLTWGFQWDFNLAPGQSFLISKDKQITPVPAPGVVALFGAAAFTACGRRRSAR